MSEELTYSQVKDHSSKKSLYVVIHSKVYNATVFIDEHPGGEEVLLDVAGQDASEAFEDVGHSDEAREILEELLVGPLKRQARRPNPPPLFRSYSHTSSLTTVTPSQPGDPEPQKASRAPQAKSDYGSAQSKGSILGVGLYAFIFLGGAAAYGAYRYLQAKPEN